MRLLLLGLLALAGCQSKPVEQMSYSETKEMFRELHERCAEQGAPIGHPENEPCIRQELSREASIRRDNYEKQKNAIMCQRFGTMVVCG